MKKLLVVLGILVVAAGCGKGKIGAVGSAPDAQTNNMEAVAGYHGCGGEWEAKWGDTLADKAWAMWHGKFTYLEILKANPDIKDPNLIYAGKVYAIPSPGL